ncbi:hypothetical protein FACS1894217_11060 [Clostridia bacterium]|nr:hypothetical protein FACS1894217_11060 [Clostridia bacterium]
MKITDESIAQVPLTKIPTMSGIENIALRECHRALLREVSKQPDGTEIAIAYDLKFNELSRSVGGAGKGNVKIQRVNRPHVMIHNHPDGLVFSHTDIISFANNPFMNTMTAVGNNGRVYSISRLSNVDNVGLWNFALTLQSNVIPLISSGDEDSYIFLIRSFLKEVGRYGCYTNYLR